MTQAVAQTSLHRRRRRPHRCLPQTQSKATRRSSLLAPSSDVSRDLAHAHVAHDLDLGGSGSHHDLDLDLGSNVGGSETMSIHLEETAKQTNQVREWTINTVGGLLCRNRVPYARYSAWKSNAICCAPQFMFGTNFTTQCF